MTRRMLLVAQIAALAVGTTASADSAFESPKLTPGIVVDGAAFESPKMTPGIVVDGVAFESPKMTPGIVVQGTAFLSPKLSVGIVVEAVANSGGNVPRAPLTHW